MKSRLIHFLLPVKQNWLNAGAGWLVSADQSISAVNPTHQGTRLETGGTCIVQTGPTAIFCSGRRTASQVVYCFRPNIEAANP